MSMGRISPLLSVAWTESSRSLPPSPGAVTTTVAPSTGIWAWET